MSSSISWIIDESSAVLYSQAKALGADDQITLKYRLSTEKYIETLMKTKNTTPAGKHHIMSHARTYLLLFYIVLDGIFICLLLTS
jgi:hypothetical protein